MAGLLFWERKNVMRFGFEEVERSLKKVVVF